MHLPTPLSVFCCHSNSIKLDLPVAISRWQMADCICASFGSARVGVATTKLILHDGRLQEFYYSVKVSYVLQMNLMCFLCNVDEMDFEHTISAIEEDQELRPSQLYFALPLPLPLRWLNHPLQPQVMASLAVKATSSHWRIRITNPGFVYQIGFRLWIGPVNLSRLRHFRHP
ncbi:hypothetical protein V6N13_020161 [Hibiscus sabdariffa]|uniref:DUF4166 domain-containing protein n=1 Tax=Hibiscus sabdariffa TaxID=183260 RepID=A0ABR2ESQ1_9ROSI